MQQPTNDDERKTKQHHRVQRKETLQLKTSINTTKSAKNKQL